MNQTRLLFIDLLLTAIATVVALALRDNFEVSRERLEEFLPYLLCTLATATVMLSAFQTNRSVWQFTSMSDYLRILAATVAVVISAVALCFTLNRMDGIARALPALQGLLILFGLVGARVLMRLWRVVLERPRRVEAAERTYICKTVLVVGLGELASLYCRSIVQCAPDRIRIAGFLGHDDRHVGRSVQGHPILGTPEQVADALRRLEVHGVFVDSIVVTVPFERLSPPAQRALLDVEAVSNIEIEFLIDQMGLGPRPAADVAIADAAENLAAFSFDADELATLMRRPYWSIKRAVDFIGASVLLVVLAPLALLAAFLAAIDVGWPITFWQQRPGRHGRPFKLYKLRTMAAAHDARGQRVPDERRVSAIGRFSRRMRLDELPQLLNILSGEMSFVGPRPLLPIDQPAAYSARLLVRPGLTGWAQVNGGREISAADKAALDVWYVRNASLALDFEIALRTVSMVILGERVDARAIRRAWRELRQAGVYKVTEATPAHSGSVAFLSATRGELQA
jgi:lipopolysaccharide/colanic/teichoic acid biosynthesis glycosyltransferase